MRIAVLSDVHGSLVALEAVIADIRGRSPDLIVHGGDLALSGPRPAEVVDRIRELGWPGVVGNTDELLWRPDELDRQLDAAPQLEPLLRALFEALAPATLERLGSERVAWLRSLPVEWRADGVTVLHASPDSLWRAPARDAPDDELGLVYRELGAVVVYGHIHRPFVRKLSDSTIANSGSVGMPYDGDSRASYLLVDDGEPRVVRVPYDIEAECSDLVTSGYPEAEWLAEIRRRARYIPPPVSAGRR
jgi:putative phosphoesterase